VNYIAFSGGGAALAAVLSGQLSAAVSGYAEFAGQIAAGQLRVLAISSPERVAGIDAPTLRESGIALDLANWRAVVAPAGLSDVEQAALTQRLTTLSASRQWQDVLAKNGWEDQFLAGTPFRQFLLAEQSRIEAVLQRLNATNSAPPAAFAIRLTPNTLPWMIGTLFVIALGLTTAQTLRHPPRFDPAGSRMAIAIVSALIILPVIFVTAGFIASSTILFTASAAALRGQRPSTRRLALDIIVGGAFSVALFIVFTRGLGVSLPGPPFR
jgi:hypothetical protein